MAFDDDDRFDDQASRPDPFEHEDKDDLFNPELDQPRLPNDYDHPAATPDDIEETIPPSHQETDTNVDPGELYDEGLSSATDIDAQHEDETGERPEERLA